MARIPQDPKKTCQLHTTLHLAEKLTFEITHNIDTADGITNESSCTIQKIATSTDNMARGIIRILFDKRTNDLMVQHGEITTNTSAHKTISSLKHGEITTNASTHKTSSACGPPFYQKLKSSL